MQNQLTSLGNAKWGLVKGWVFQRVGSAEGGAVTSGAPLSSCLHPSFMSWPLWLSTASWPSLVWMQRRYHDLCEFEWPWGRGPVEEGLLDSTNQPTVILAPGARDTVSVLGRDEGYTVKYNPLPEGVPEGGARWNS